MNDHSDDSGDAEDALIELERMHENLGELQGSTPCMTSGFNSDDECDVVSNLSGFSEFDCVGGVAEVVFFCDKLLFSSSSINFHT